MKLVFCAAQRSGKITIACFAILIWFVVRPDERDLRHPKYRVMDDES